jgi:murein DD-endopeptidase MepM/ murein hydrolase activator NlpD
MVRRFFYGCFVLVFSLQGIFPVHAPFTHADTKEEVDALNDQVKAQRARVKKLDQLINGYKQRINEQESKQASLENEVALLDNRVAKKRLDIERSKAELEALRLEIASLEEQIGERGARIERQKNLAADMLRRMHAADGVMPLEVLLTEESLSTFFNRIEEITRLERDLEDALSRVKQEKIALEGIQKEEDAKRQRVEIEQKNLRKEELALEAERNFKASLTQETKLKQSEFERVVYELKEQQQSTADDIASLEDKLKEKLDSIDAALARGDVLLNWPVDPSRGITSKFHDPDYPFRHLFEHPGTDVRAKVGTPVKAAAGGYVAWNKKGRLYGNYTMIVHPGNIATVYAHLSRFVAKADTYVDRGDVIAESGGMPGQAGAGLSTGPHLHFEVRQDGIPVNPENYLPSAD